ncbi:MAG: nicotinate (nicotinamide) nucleotide adenylyltransferase [Desulfosarcinaceae bacterium]
MARIGLFGGTYNPIHRGHIAVARQLRKDFPLDRIYLIPSRVPPHKGRSDLAPAVHRLAMIELALAGVGGQRKGPAYTEDTVETFREQLTPDDDLYLIMGADAFLELDSWRRWRALLAAVSLIVMSRPGSAGMDEGPARRDWHPLAAYACEHLDGDYRLHADPWRLAHPRLPPIYFAAVPDWDLSSSQVRRRLRRGETVKKLVPAKVAAYIASKGLYQ